MSDDAPVGLMLAIANAHDDEFRWKVAAACVKVATVKLESDPEDAFAKKVIYQWTDVGEVFARHLAIGGAMPTGVSDDDIVEGVLNSWDTLKE